MRQTVRRIDQPHHRQRDKLREELTLAKTPKPSMNSTERASWPSQNGFCRVRRTSGCRRRSITSSGCSSCFCLKASRSMEIDLIEPPQRHRFQVLGAG
jgi:hypothetical protein